MMINPDILVYIAILIMVIALILSIREFIREKRAFTETGTRGHIGTQRNDMVVCRSQNDHNNG